MNVITVCFDHVIMKNTEHVDFIENGRFIKFLDNTSSKGNLTDAEIFDFVIRHLGNKQEDTFSASVLTCVYIVIFISGIFGNISTCLVIKRNRHMHTTTNLYLVNLAFADLLIVILGKYSMSKWRY